MSPGVPTDLPFVEKAKKAGVKVMGEMNLHGFSVNLQLLVLQVLTARQQLQLL